MNNQRSISWGRVIPTGILCFLLLFGVLWLFRLRFIPAENARIYGDPISSIQSIQICPEGPFPLVSNVVVITNKVSIQEIMTAIRSGQPCFANHPATRWACTLVISSSSGAGRLYILNTLGQGTVLGNHLRNDKLAAILEKAMGQDATNNE
jgi:hypothetical protein